MAYLVKETLTSTPRPYILEGIASDYSQKMLAGNALVRAECQDFWYSVAELVGESSATEFQFACPRCKAITHAREIDVGLEVPCRKCGEVILVPDIKPQKDPAQDYHLLRRGKLLLLVGGVIFFGNLAFSLSGHGIFVVSRILEIVGVCMMINGYGKRSHFYRQHPPVDQFTPPPPI